MQTHELKRANANKKAIAVGRGGKRGKTSGRGMKGQKARAGHRLRPELRDIIKKIPKRRGHGVNRSRTVNPSVVKPEVINLTNIEQSFKDGETVSPETLVEKGLLEKKSGRLPKVKVLGVGNLSTKVTISSCLISEAAADKVKGAGGQVA